MYNFRWYRGQVVEKEKDQSNVFFVDHGDTEWVPNYLIQRIHSALLEVLCMFSAIKPSNESLFHCMNLKYYLCLGCLVTCSSN